MHTAGIYADMTVDGPLIGTLVMIIDRAKNLPNRKTIGKQHPYCAARLGKDARKTNTDVRGGQTPKWDQELRFEVHDSTDYNNLKLSVFNDDKKTDLIGETWIDLRNVITPGGGQNDAWHPLKYRDKYAGEIRIEMSYYDSRAPAEGSVAGDMAGSRKTSRPKRRPLPSDPIASSPASAFGPRNMGARTKELSSDQSCDLRSPASLTGSVPRQEWVRHSRSNGSPFSPDEYRYNVGYEHSSQGDELEIDADMMQPDFLPRLPPKNAPRDSMPSLHGQFGGYQNSRQARPHGQQHLAHHQSLPNVRQTRAAHLQRHSVGEPRSHRRQQSYDDYDYDYEQSFHETIPEDGDFTDGYAPLPTPPRRLQNVSQPANAASPRPLPSPVSSAHYSPMSIAEEPEYRQMRRPSADNSPSPRHRSSQGFSIASPTLPSPLRRELPPSPATHAHPLRHAHSSNFAGSLQVNARPSGSSHPPMSRHSVSDPYANTSPSRDHPLSREIRGFPNPQQGLPDPEYYTSTTPPYRPQAVSPRESRAIANMRHSPHNSSPQGVPCSPQYQGQTSNRSTPARKAVAASGMPFSPDSFDVLNPAARSAIPEVSTNPQKPYQTPTSPLLSQGRDRSRTSLGATGEPIRSFDGREIDPSDHLPVDSWAPEPEQKVPTKEYGTSDRGFGPRAAAPPAERSKRSSLLVNMRNKIDGGGTSPITVSSSNFPASPTAKNGLIKKSDPVPSPTNRRPMGGTHLLTEIDVPNARFSDQYRNDSPLDIDGYNCHGRELTSVDYRDHGYGSSALERELSLIDIGGSWSRNTRQSTSGGNNGGHGHARSGARSGQDGRSDVGGARYWRG